MKLELGARFKKDFKRIQKRKLAEQQLWDVVGLLLAGQELPHTCKQHPLKGNWNGFMECHIAPDWILIWREVDNKIILTRTGTHSDLFKK